MQRHTRKIFVGLIIIIMTIVTAGCSRTMFNSEKEMQDSVIGAYWVEPTDEESLEILMDITAENISHYIYTEKGYIDQTWQIEQWNPKRGTIKTTKGNYVVLNDGKVKSWDGEVFDYLGEHFWFE